MTIEEVEEQLKKDVYWDSATCLEKGLIDEIIQQQVVQQQVVQQQVVYKKNPID
jgi:ATP-dependent protease ClpP protease subunit